MKDPSHAAPPAPDPDRIAPAADKTAILTLHGQARRLFLTQASVATAALVAPRLLPAQTLESGEPAALEEPCCEALETTAARGNVPICICINGEQHALAVEPRVTLLDLLREELEFTGTKKGCDHGQCGACTVLIDGRRINSCLALAVMHDGAQVTTIEGLAKDDKLHPLQAAFIEHDGFQCGYCTPGQICSAVGMLAEARAGMASAATPNLTDVGSPVRLTDDEIRERMSGNICRCGAYDGIVAAVRQASGRGSA
jgi:xanthine dehydrogenase YagT iron-sulfur-binding subunit